MAPATIERAYLGDRVTQLSLDVLETVRAARLAPEARVIPPATAAARAAAAVVRAAAPAASAAAPAPVATAAPAPAASAVPAAAAGAAAPATVAAAPAAAAGAAAPATVAAAPAGGTLDDLIAGAWRQLGAQRVAACPICAEPMRAVAGTRSAECRSCGATLSG